MKIVSATVWWNRRGHWTWLATSAAFGAVCALVGGMLVSDDGPPGLEKGELVILSGLDQSAGGQRQRLIDQWNRLHPDNQARIIEVPSDADAQHAQMIAHAQSGREDVDIYNLDVTRMAEFAYAGFIRELDPSHLDLTGFLRGPLKTCEYQDKLWCLPFNTDAGLLYYRTDLLDRRPESWSDIVVDIQRVLGHGPAAGVVAGYAVQLAAYEGLTVNFLESIQSVAHGSVVANGRLTAQLEQLNEAVDRLRPTEEKVKVVLPESLDHREIDSTNAFREGKVLYMRNWPVAYRTIATPAASESTTAAVQFDVAPLPGPGVLGGQNLAIAGNTSRPRAAQALIEFLTSDYSEQILFERGGFAATRTIVYEDEDVRRNHPYAATLKQAIDSAQPRPVTPCYSTFSEILRTAVDKALRDQEPAPPETIDDLNATLSDCPG